VSHAIDYLDHRVAEVATFLHKHPGSVSRWIGTQTDVVYSQTAVKRILDIAVAELNVVSAVM
jgi:hypothetical protein